MMGSAEERKSLCQSLKVKDGGIPQFLKSSKIGE